MNTFLSLLIYNPLEAVAIILLCDILSGNRTRLSIRNVLFLYLFGGVSYCIQDIANLWFGDMNFIFANVLVVVLIYPFIIYTFYFMIYGKMARYRIFVVASLVDNTFILTISFILNMLFRNTNPFYNNDIKREFIIDITIFTILISLLIFIKKKEISYEKRFEGNRKKCNC